MTAPTQAGKVIITVAPGLGQCPHWCLEDVFSDGAVLHRRDLSESWGHGNEQISVALERQDECGALGDPYLSFQYLRDGQYVEKVVDIALPGAESMQQT